MNKKKHRNFLLFILPLIFLSVLLNLLARNIEGFAEFYAVNVYPYFVNTIGRFSALFPFSVVEIGLYLLVLCLVVLFVIGIIRLIKRKLKFLSFILVSIETIVGVAVSLFFVYTLTCEINYHRYTFSSLSGFEIKASTEAELVELCEYFVSEINTLSEELNIKKETGLKLPENTGKITVEAMEKLGKVYPELNGFYPRPKEITVSEILSYSDISGVYSPFTVEANINGDIVAFRKPLALCHELSHLKGFMREDEANFIAFLACENSNSPELRYSGLLEAYVYSSNALYKWDSAKAKEITAKLNENVYEELIRDREFWNRYKGKTAEVSGKINDGYLKFNAQHDGVQSYGRVVDLLLAWRRQTKLYKDL